MVFKAQESLILEAQIPIVGLHMAGDGGLN